MPSGSVRSSSRPKNPVTSEEFSSVLWWTSEAYQTAIVALGITGIDSARYAGLTREDLDFDLRAIRLTEETSTSGPRLVWVAEALWPYIMWTIPLALDPGLLRRAWRTAASDADLPSLQLRCLSRFAMCMLVEDGFPRRVVKATLGRRASDPWRFNDYRVIANSLASLLPGLSLSHEEIRRLVLRLA